MKHSYDAMRHSYVENWVFLGAEKSVFGTKQNMTPTKSIMPHGETFDFFSKI